MDRSELAVKLAAVRAATYIVFIPRESGVSDHVLRADDSARVLRMPQAREGSLVFVFTRWLNAPLPITVGFKHARVRFYSAISRYRVFGL